jgi:hypothetical protein
VSPLSSSVQDPCNKHFARTIYYYKKIISHDGLEYMCKFIVELLEINLTLVEVDYDMSVDKSAVSGSEFAHI